MVGDRSAAFIGYKEGLGSRWLRIEVAGDRQAAVPLVGDAREDWQILRALSEVLGVTLPYDTLDAVRDRLAAVAPSFAHVYELEKPLWLNGEYMKVC